MAQLRFDWVLGAFPDYSDPPLDSVTVNGTNALSFTLIDPFDLEDKNDSLRVERVVGDVMIVERRAGGELVTIESVERIYTTAVDEVNAILEHNLQSGTDFDRTFMWERRMIWQSRATADNVGNFVTPVRRTNYDFGMPWYTHVDCQVARRLRDREVLVYQFQVAEIGAGQLGTEFATFEVHPALRVGVRF